MIKNNKKAVIIYGPPGSGKGTQAELLARKYNFIHFDSGRYIESLIRGSGANKDPVLKREKKLFDAGILCTPSWILKISSEASRRVAKAGMSIVFSGSPRTLFEAFGDKNHKGLFATLIKTFGKKNLDILKLNVRGKTSIKRNSTRLVCSLCGLPLLGYLKHPHCAFCASGMRKRTLDDPKIIKVRLKEYRERTYPIINGAKKIGVRVHKINGEPLPYKVFAEIVRALGLNR